eukprot:TRINITY_DN1737_c0_g1_i4.p2 TRINITY_DN1737_c0_g1~~TRINITY_DN1737_c0_g1_i4.p2  ORF type:complete len:215 (+),score=22.09 TRINITY_DN1737_c0_g1_i4:88-732(+)
MSLSVVLDKLEEMQKPYASTVDGFKSATRASENQSATIRELLSRLGDAQEERRTAVLSVDQLRTSLANSQAETKLWRHAYMCERRRQHAAAVRYGAHQAAQGMKVDAVEDRVSSSDDDGRSVASECPCPECPGASARCQGQEYTKGGACAGCTTVNLLRIGRWSEQGKELTKDDHPEWATCRLVPALDWYQYAVDSLPRKAAEARRVSRFTSPS